MRKYSRLKVYAVLYGCVMASCAPDQPRKQSYQKLHSVPAVAYIPSGDSSFQPTVTPVEHGKLKKIVAGKPDVFNAHPQVKSITGEIIVSGGKPVITQPGKDSFLLPEVYTCKPVVIPFVRPEIIEVKDPYVRDKNGQSISTFNTLHGLKHSLISDIHEDKNGALWFTSIGGGAARYDGKHFCYFTIDNGLTDDHTRKIYQDKKGNIWICSTKGISKYDGHSITQYTVANGLKADYFVSIHEDEKGNFWFGSYGGGLCYFDGKQFTWYSKKQGLPDNGVRGSAIDKEGNIWCATNGGVSRFDGKKFSSYSAAQGLPDERYSALFVDSKGNIWVGTEGKGLCWYDGKTWHWLTTEQGLGSNYVMCFYEDSTGEIWIGTENGVSVYNGKTLRSITQEEGLNGKFVFCIFEDKIKNLWIGTEGGLSKCTGRAFQHFTKEDGLTGDFIFSIERDNNNRLWFATENGLTVYNESVFTHLSPKQGLPFSYIFSVCKDRTGQLWFGTYGNGAVIYNGDTFIQLTAENGLGTDYLWAITKDRNGNMWFATENGVCCYTGTDLINFTTKNGSTKKILSLKADRKGNVWFGTSGAGVCMFDGKKFVHYRQPEWQNRDINSIEEDEHGNIWFATSGGGVCRFSSATQGGVRKERFTWITKKEGLLSNIVYTILADGDGNMLFGTSSGLSTLSKKKNHLFLKSRKAENHRVVFDNYQYGDGFLGISVNSGKAMFSDKGKVWIGTDDRLTVFNPDELPVDSLAPVVEITHADLFDEKTPWASMLSSTDTVWVSETGETVHDVHFDGITPWNNLPVHLSLPYSNNSITFRFVGISMFRPKEIKYRYKLEGWDKNWSSYTRSTVVPYANLSSGHYTFTVQAVNASGYVSNKALFEFTIRPPWWKTWWFISIEVMLCCGLLWGLYRLRTRTLRKKQKELEHTVAERTAEIREKQNEIIDSINYAKRLQQAILARPEEIKKYLPDSFLLYQPKDIVAGDFYFFETTATHIFIAAADCTGHGVPGAMVSVVCSNALTRCVKEFTLSDPGHILEKASELVTETFDKSGANVKDGMDISFVSMNRQTGEIRWAGAHNALWYTTAHGIFEIKATKRPVGRSENAVPFVSHVLPVSGTIQLYLLTDGFADQFGGPKGKKFKNSNLQLLIHQLSSLSMSRQQQGLNEAFHSWKGGIEQLDDICILGIRINPNS